MHFAMHFDFFTAVETAQLTKAIYFYINTPHLCSIKKIHGFGQFWLYMATYISLCGHILTEKTMITMICSDSKECVMSSAQHFCQWVSYLADKLCITLLGVLDQREGKTVNTVETTGLQDLTGAHYRMGRGITHSKSQKSLIEA